MDAPHTPHSDRGRGQGTAMPAQPPWGCAHSYLGLDVLLGGGHQAGTAEPQHHHDGEEEAGGQDPARKARAPVAPRHPPPKRRDEFMAGHGLGIGLGQDLLRHVQQVPDHLLGHAAEEVVLLLRRFRGVRLGSAPRLLHGGLVPLRPGAWEGRGDADGHPGGHTLPSPIPLPAWGSPSPPGTLCPLRGRRGSQQLGGAGPHPEPPQRGCGKLVRPEKWEICSALENPEGSRGGSEAPSPLPAAQNPPHLCGAGGHQGWIPVPIPAVLAGSPGPRVLETPSQAGTGPAGREGEGSEEGVPTPLGTPREGPGDTPT